MNIVSALKERVSMAKGREYLSGSQIAEETVSVIADRGFEVYEVVRMSSASKHLQVDASKAVTEIFMSLEKAMEFAEQDSKRLCELNRHFDRFIYKCGRRIEIENTNNEEIKYEYEIRVKKVN